MKEPLKRYSGRNRKNQDSNRCIGNPRDFDLNIHFVPFQVLYHPDAVVVPFAVNLVESHYLFTITTTVQSTVIVGYKVVGV